MLYYVDLVFDGGSGRAFSYDAGTKALTATDSRVSVETGSGCWALLIDGDYSLIFDSDGMSSGEFTKRPTTETPRLDFYAYKCGVKQLLASVAQSGVVYAPRFNEADSLPAGMNLYDDVVLNASGLTTSALSEIRILTTEDGNYITTHDGLLICQ